MKVQISPRIRGSPSVNRLPGVARQRHVNPALLLLYTKGIQFPPQRLYRKWVWHSTAHSFRCIPSGLDGVWQSTAHSFRCISSGLDAENSGLTQLAVYFPQSGIIKSPVGKPFIPAPHEYLKRLSRKPKEWVKQTLRRPLARSRRMFLR